MKDTEIKYRNKRYYITGTPYSFDNYKTAEQLQKELKHYHQLKNELKNGKCRLCGAKVSENGGLQLWPKDII